MASGIQAFEKTNKLLSVITLCRNTLSIMLTWHKHCHESIINKIFVTCVVLMEAIFPCFNLKPDDCNLATAILGHKFSQSHKTLILGRL